ncbi:hypothetical protein PaG_01336 [Moesziomyces aphidis]|uniref:Uncharacterized protein n=1 Tax=Moesziomyces aphidis TaxID=84754 RepID=W3VTG8_MOEAP|nr:hypothetical protein PaG_01336 [Moesziomyces aphidis]
MPASTDNSSAAGPSRLSSSPRATFYPSWPDSHDEAEYFEVPPDHFLAQQRGPHKAQPSNPSEHPLVRHLSASSSTATRSASIDAAPTTILPAPEAHAALLASSQPLAELASAVQSGIPAAPSSVARPNPPLDRLADAVPRPAGFSTVDGQIPDTSTLAAADFDVDVRSGFLPPEAPVLRLTGPHADHWEHALDQAKRIPLMQGGGGVTITPQQRLLARRWRRSLRDMPVLPLSDELANDIRFARRGHVLLSFLAHFYIHSQPRKADHTVDTAPARSWLNIFSRKSPEELQDDQDLADELAAKFARRVPAAIAVPWVQLSQKLDLPPVLTYATTVLWNWQYIDPTRGLEPDNLRIVETFTGTPSEHHFFFTSLLIEARGVEALQLMRVSLDEAFVADRVARRRIAANLNKLALVLQDLTRLLHDVRNGCDPKIFYWGIRPWFVGSDTVDKGEEIGWHFEGVDPEGVKRVFSGPSAGQSTVIHAVDVFLDVDHTRRKERLNRPAVTSNGDARGADATFMERMSLYMPGHHRAFLSHLRSISFDDADDADDEDAVAEDDASAAGSEAEQEQPRERPHPIRSLALKAQTDEHDEGLPAAYDNALTQLKALRDEHMKIAYLYIVAQARGSPPPAYAPLPKGFTGEPAVDRKLAKARAQSDEAEADAALDTASNDNGGGAKGTGGTDLVSFLRDCRVNTIDALIMAKDTVVAAATRSADASSSGQSTLSASIPPSSAITGGAEGGPARDVQTSVADANSVGGVLMPRADSQMQVWAIDISDVSWLDEGALGVVVDELLPGTCNAAERDKVMRYHRHVDRVRSLVARLLPRMLLSKRFGVAWEAVRFGATPQGRPYISAPQLPVRVDYNLSHDGHWVVMAFHISSQGEEVRVGVDVMAVALPRYETDVRAFVDTMDMALTRAETRWVLEPEREGETLTRLYTLWTYKEAYTKQLGLGLGFDFARIELRFPMTGVASLRVDGSEVGGCGFVDVLLPARGGSSSQLVVCLAPHEPSFRSQVDGHTAEGQGWLQIVSFSQLVNEARRQL